MKLLELSNRLHQKLGNPNNLAVGVIQYWLRFSLGRLNNLIFTSYSLQAQTGDVEGELGENEAGILEQMYFVYYYDVKIRENLGAASIDSVLEIAENGAVVRLISKNEISKTYVQMKRLAQEELDKLVSGYKMLNSIPVSVNGTDTQEGEYTSNDLEVRQGS